MISTFSLVLLILVAAFLFLLRALTPPSNFPSNIPTIPFYVTLIPFFKQVDQAQIYKQYLEKPLANYGAVKIYFGCRWNILVQRPEFIAEIFKREDTYAKSGNQVKIPYSVLAEYTGDNIISSHGENWRLYHSIIKPGLQRNFDIAPIVKNAHILVDMFLKAGLRDTLGRSSGGVVVPQLVQRCTLANLSEVILGSNFHTLDSNDAPLHTLQLNVKREIFKPTFLTFPFLDKLPLKSRQHARVLSQRFTDILCQTVTHSHEGDSCTPTSSNLGCRMLAALQSMKLSRMQFRHNMVAVFLAGHENPQLLLVSMMYLLGKDQGAQERLRNEILNHVPSGLEEASATVLQNMPYLTSIIYETLRLYPPISQLINRRTSEPVALGGQIAIPQGTYIGYHAYSTNRDKKAWGLDADIFRPERWGTTMDEIATSYRRVNSRCEFISFHGGRRACLGERYAMLSTRVMVVEIMRRVRWTIDDKWQERMTPAGPLYPMQLSLLFEPVDSMADARS